MKKNEITATETATANNSLGFTYEAMNKLGYGVVKHAENDKGAYELQLDKDVDGEKVAVFASVHDEEEKRAIDELDILANIDTYKPAKQCALFAFIEEKGTWKNYGVKFSAYAQSINPKLADNTIRQYLNVGKCFMKSGTTEPEWVDERLKGVSVTNLCAILSTFKAYADKKEIDGAKDLRDYVSAFLDDFIDTDKIHLHATTPQVKDECAVLAGRPTSEDRKKEREAKKTEPEVEKLNDTDALLLALKNYITGKPENEEVYKKAVELVQLLTPPTNIANANNGH